MSFIRFIVKLALILVVLVSLVVAGLLWWFNSYLNKPESIETLRGFVSNAIGIPIDVGRLEINLLHGARMQDVRGDNPDAALDRQILKIAGAEVRYNLLALLQREVQVTKVVLDSPRLQLELDGDQQLILPRRTPSSPSIEEGAPSANDSTGTPFEGWSFLLQSLEIKDGSLVLRASDGSERLLINGLNNDATLRHAASGFTAQGQAVLGELGLGPIRLTEVRSPYSLDSSFVRLPKITATAYKGTVQGEMEGKLQEVGLPYTFKLNLSNLDVNDLITRLGNRKDVLSGQLNATTQWRGSLAQPKTIGGRGNFELANGQLISIEFFRKLAQVLGIEQLAQPDYTRCRSDFVIENEVVTISSLVLNGTLFDFTTSGTVRFDNTLDLQCELVCKPDLVRLMPAAVADRFTARDDGARTVAFRLTGAMNQPDTDLWLKLAIGGAGIEGAIERGVDAIRSLFR